MKVQACEHLLENSIYLAFLLLLVLTVPMAAVSAAEVETFWAIPVLLFALSMGALVAVYLAPQRAWIKGPGDALRFFFLWNGFMMVTTGLVVHNGLAALSGLLGHGGEFVRTPKRNTITTTSWNLRDAYLPRGLGRPFLLEVAFWLYFGAGIVLGAWNGSLELMLGPIVAFCGLTYMLTSCLHDFFAQWSQAARAHLEGPVQ